MAICLCSALIAALQGPPPADSLAEWWRRVAADSTDAPAWLALGRAYVARAGAYHVDHAPGGDRDAASALDTAAHAFARAVVRPPGPARDTALAYAAFTWGEAALLAWEVEGLAAVGGAEPAATRLRLPPVLAELAENLLRACPDEGVLLTAGDTDTYASWFLRFGRRLRPDLIIVPLAIWEADPVFRDRVAGDLQLPREAVDEQPDAVWRTLAGRRPVCASTAFAAPPLAAARLGWRAAPLVWVAGPVRRGAAPATDFVFEAARLAHGAGDAWAADVVAIYRRAATIAPSLCAPLGVFDLADATGCAPGR